MTPDGVETLLAGRRVALVHDWLTGLRGGERVLHQLALRGHQEHLPMRPWSLYDFGTRQDWRAEMHRGTPSLPAHPARVTAPRQR